MNEKVLQVFYGADCLPYKDQARSVHFPIVGSSFLGASNTTEIRFYFERIGDENATYIASAKLPNGKQGYKLLQKIYDTTLGEWYAKLPISGFFTQVNGDLYISLRGYQGGAEIIYDDEQDIYKVEGDPVIQGTGIVKLNISYAVPYLEGDVDEEITLEDIYSEIGKKLNIISDNYIVVVEDITDTTEIDLTEFPNGTILYDKTTKEFYKKIAESPYCERYLINYVPYEGAEDNVDLGNYDFKANNIELKSFLDIKDSLGVYGSSLYIDENHNLHFILANTSVGQTGEFVIPYNISGTATTKEYADTELAKKVDKITSGLDNQAIVAYVAKNVNGTYSDDKIQVSSSPTGYSIPRRTADGKVKTATPTENDDSATKKYVDDQDATKVDKTSSANKLYGTNAFGSQTTLDYGVTANSDDAGKIVRRTDNGQINVPETPTNDKHATSKKYVDDEIVSAISRVYKLKGTKTVAELNALTGQAIGDVYNVSDNGTLTAGNLQVVAGDNVAWTGTAWDKLAGDIDLSDYYTKSETNSLLNQKANLSVTVIDDDLNISGGYVTQIRKDDTWYNIAENVDVTTIPKVVATTSDLPATNDGYLYLVLEDGYLYYWDETQSDWAQSYKYVQDVSDFVQKTRQIAGNNLANDISAQTLTDSLILATTSEVGALFD